MKMYSGTFKKKDGSVRTINFVKLEDIPQEKLASMLTGGDNKRPTRAVGVELVFDVDLKEFRSFNWKTVIGEVQEKEINLVL